MLKKHKLIFIAALLLLLAGGGLLIAKRRQQAIVPSSPPSSLANEEAIDPNIKVDEGRIETEQITPVSQNMVNLVFLGKGGEDHDGGGLTDSITLASFNYGQKTIKLIAIPRDLWYNNRKINAAYSSEGSSGIKNNLGQITGLKVNYFLAIDFDNFISAIDALGGIDVDNPKTWEDNFYPVKGKEQELCGFTPEQNAELNRKYTGFTLEKQYVCRYEQLCFDKGMIHLDGVTALKYIRSRHSAEYGSDFSRGERAQAVLLGVGKKLLSQNLLEAQNPVLKQLAGLVATDITAVAMSQILQTLGNLSAYTIKYTNLTDQNVLVGGTGPKGAYILVPKAGNNDFSSVRELCLE